MHKLQRPWRNVTSVTLDWAISSKQKDVHLLCQLCPNVPHEAGMRMYMLTVLRVDARAKG